jgi:TRAP-type C4-dicarboxylate transport system permease small subunit
VSQTTAVKTSSVPARMIIAGLFTALAGWMTRNYAASRMQEALRIAAIRDPKGGPSVDSAIALGYIGLGMIIFGAALFLAGLVVMARRRQTADSPVIAQRVP